MNSKWTSKVSIFFLALILVIAAAGCGGGAAGGGGGSGGGQPVYTGAVELKPGEDPIADTLAKNMQQDASIRQNMGVGGSMEQKVYKLPADGSWDAVKAYYDQALTAGGWQKGPGGPAGEIANQALEAANSANEMVKTAVWSKGKQILTIVWMVEQPGASQKYLITSLNSN